MSTERYKGNRRTTAECTNAGRDRGIIMNNVRDRDSWGDPS